MRATRAQADRVLYKQAIRRRLENQPNLTIFAQACDDLIMEGDRVVGAVSIGVPTFRVDRERLLSFVAPLREAIDQLEQLWPVRAHALARAR